VGKTRKTTGGDNARAPIKGQGDDCGDARGFDDRVSDRATMRIKNSAARL